MAIYTSNYARKGGDPGAIAISAGPPDYYFGAKSYDLAPSWPLLNAYRDGRIGKEEYRIQYNKMLESLDRDWGKWLNNLPDPTYFLCFETPGQFCHRRLFAEWVEQNCGWHIPEWKNPKEVEAERQLEMVDELFNF